MSFNKISVYVLLFFCLVSTNCRSAERTISLLSWEGYYPQEVLKKFEEKYNVKVDYKFINSIDEIQKKLSAEQYDVVMVPDYLVKKLIKQKLLSKLDKKQKPSLARINKRFTTPSYDPKLEYCIPFSWGTTGIGYNKKYVTKEEASSWKVFFNPKFKGKIAMLDEPKELFLVALKSLGYSMNSTNIKELEAAKKLLIDQKPFVKMYSPDFKEPLIKEEIWIAHGWNGDVVKAKAKNPNIEFSIPANGSSAWRDNFCVHSKSNNLELATKLINFISEAKMAAIFTNEIQYATPFKGTEPYLKEEIKNNISIFPTKKQLSTLEFYGDLKDTIIRDETWSIIKPK